MGIRGTATVGGLQVRVVRTEASRGAGTGVLSELRALGAEIVGHTGGLENAVNCRLAHRGGGAGQQRADSGVVADGVLGVGFVSLLVFELGALCCGEGSFALLPSFAGGARALGDVVELTGRRVGRSFASGALGLRGLEGRGVRGGCMTGTELLVLELEPLNLLHESSKSRSIDRNSASRSGTAAGSGSVVGGVIVGARTGGGSVGVVGHAAGWGTGARGYLEIKTKKN
jgi:hypothetical protein